MTSLETLETVAAVIAALDGTDAVAKLTGKKKSAVSMWKAREHFPNDIEIHQVITKALRKVGKVAAPHLFGRNKARGPSHPEGAAA